MGPRTTVVNGSPETVRTVRRRSAVIRETMQKYCLNKTYGLISRDRTYVRILLHNKEEPLTPCLVSGVNQSAGQYQTDCCNKRAERQILSSWQKTVDRLPRIKRFTLTDESKLDSRRCARNRFDCLEFTNRLNKTLLHLPD